MSLEDDTLHKRAHHEAIRLAFQAHGILLGAVVAVAPRAALRGAAPKRVRRGRQAGAGEGDARGPALAHEPAAAHGDERADLRSRRHARGGGEPSARGAAARAVRAAHERRRARAGAHARRRFATPGRRDGRVTGRADDQRRGAHVRRRARASRRDRLRREAGGGCARGGTRGRADARARSRTSSCNAGKGQKVLERMRFSCGGGLRAA